MCGLYALPSWLGMEALMLPDAWFYCAWDQLHLTWDQLTVLNERRPTILDPRYCTQWDMNIINTDSMTVF